MVKDSADVIKANAMLNELSEQRAIMGNRAAEMMGRMAILQAENAALRERLAELEQSATAESSARQGA
jgi:regulator of replication initiation timing